MTDQETLFTYRLRQAEETLAEAERMNEEGFSARSIVNWGLLRHVLCGIGVVHPF